MNNRVRRMAVGLASAAVVGAAAVLWPRLPTNTQIFAPFDVDGRTGAPVSGRELTVTVDTVRVAAAAGRQTGKAITAAGRWIIVGGAVTATLGTMMPEADLVVGPNTYAASKRLLGATLGSELEPGITQHGSWLFDVATDLVDPRLATPFQLRVHGFDSVLDSRLVINLDTPPPIRRNFVTLAPLVRDAR